MEVMNMSTTETGSATTGQPADAPASLCEAFYATVARCPDRPAIRTREGDVITWGEYGRRARDLAAGMHELGVRPGDRVALMLATRPEFHLVDAAAMLLGAASFSIYNTAPAQDIALVLANSEPALAVVEDEFRDRLDVPQVLCVSDLAGLEARGAASSFDVAAAARAVAPDDLLTLIYTSGTTGEPKGVEITHANALFVARAVDELHRLPDAAALVTYLPMAHIGDRNNCQYWPMVFGYTVTCAPDISKVLDVMREVRPHLMFGMPRLFEKLRAIIEREADPATLAALNAARLRALGDDAAEPDEALLAAVRVEHGLERVETGITGGAMTPPDLMAFLHGLGVRIGEIWGLSEATGVGTMSRPDALRVGTAGTPLPGAEVRLAEDGEIEIRSGGVMRRYRGRPDQTAETFTADGWLRTGDIGEFDADGYLSVVDRKKELIIGSSGKNMAPARIEARIKAAFPLIGGAVAIGDARPHNVALIALDPDACQGFAREHGLAGSTPQELADDPVVHAAVERQIIAANEHLSAPERIKGFTIVPTAWLPGGDELTPTMKPRRRAILAKYAAEIDALYG
jgi:long-chain acyl-CoA synthetase